MNNKQLTTWEAACIITGYGVGGGVLSMPYLANKIGFINSLIVLVVAFAASYVLHLMIADLSFKTESGDQIIACLEQFLFKGRFKKVLTIGFFGLLLAILFTNLTGYITGAEELIVSLIHVPNFVAKLIFYIIAAAVVFFGLKFVGMSESLAVTIIFVMVGILAVASLVEGHNEVPMMKADFNGILAYYGMAMFSMSAFFSVPQAVVGLRGDRKKIKKAIFLGFLNNFVIIIVINFCALLASTEVTEVGMIGWSEGIGLWAQVVGSIFIVLAMLTTYWSLSLALADIVQETTKMGARLSWLVATLPSLILALINLGNFMEIMRLAGGLISIVIAVMIVPAFINSKKAPGGSMLKHNGKLICAITIIAYILMGIGSIVPV
ncbi:MAG: hypothetical protein KBS56_03250 [Clostridiales bacterium]|nr:hypothetical protein [Candidatus Crickella equi]